MINFNKGFEDPVIKIIARTFGVLVIILTVIVVIKVSIGQHVKLAGFEFNAPDTDIKIVYKTDTIKLEKHTNEDPIVILKPTSAFKKNQSHDTMKSNIKYNITAPVTNSAVGDNATNNNYLDGFKLRKLDSVEYKDLLRRLDSTSTKDRLNKKVVIIYTMPIAESERFALIVKEKLKEKGYKVTIDSNVGGPVSGPDVHGDFYIVSGSATLSLFIEPAKIITN